MTQAAVAVVRCAILAACAIGAAAGSADAQLVRCRGVDDPGVYKVLLDDIAPEGGRPSPLLRALVHRLDANLEQLKVETGLPLRVVRCENRRPADPADFRKSVVQQLTARQVVLEVWGTTAEVPGPGGSSFHEASIGYALVPVRFYEFGEPDPPGAFVVPRRVDSLDSTDELVLLVDQAGTLAAYAAVGAGTKMLRSREYDQARAQLCRAAALLAALSPKAGGPDAALLAYARRLAAEAVAEARGDPSYRGPLKVLPDSATSSCGGSP